jgi:ABC-type branched-subunit amino acid transport system ATPase component
VRENILVAAELHQSWSHERDFRPNEVVDALLERIGLSSVADVAADVLPTGLARLLKLARALATEPKVLLLDEPSSGLNEAETGRIGELLGELAQGGCAVVLVEHDVELVMRVCEQITVLDSGRVIAHGAAASIREDRAVQLAYLGADAEADDPRPDRAGAGSNEVSPSGVFQRDSEEDRHVLGSPPALELRGVLAGYGPIEVLHGIGLSVAPGSVLALLGPNGAGKSTTIRVACGLLPLRGGTIRVEGETVQGRPPEWMVHRGVCTVPEGRSIFPNLTVWENLKIWTHQTGVAFDEVITNTFRVFPALEARRKQAAGSLSGGEQQMLAMSRTLAGKPRVLLLDELSMGLAPLIVGGLYEIVAQLAEEGLTILVVEQVAKTALSIADHAAVINMGRIVANGSPDEIESAALDLYLGSSATTQSSFG